MHTANPLGQFAAPTARPVRSIPLAFCCFGALFAAAVVITLIVVLTPGFGRVFDALAAGLVEDPTLLAAFTT